jgi:V/A-type H+-transporting ATPase subunit I
MNKLRALVLKGHEDNVLRALQEEKAISLVSVSERSTKWEEIPRPYSLKEEERYHRTLLSRVEKLMDRLKIKEEVGLLGQLFKPRNTQWIEVSIIQEDEILSAAEEFISQCEREITEKVDVYANIQEFLENISGLNIQVQNLQSSDQIYLSIGSIRSEEMEELEEELKSKLSWTGLYATAVKEGRVHFLIAAPGSLSERVEKVLNEKQIQRLKIPSELTGTPLQCVRAIELEVSRIVMEHEKDLLILYDALKAKISRIESSRMLGETDTVVVVEGWVPTFSVVKVERLISIAAKGYATIYVSPPDEPTSRVPTKLRNPKIIEPFEILTEMYGTPSYDEIDPTPFLSVFFILFMGLMSADIAAGITTLLGGLLIYRGAGSRSENMKKLSLIVIYSGLSIALFGLLSGEFMGGLIDLPVIWLSTVDEPIEFMVLALGLGIIHILIGLMLGIYNNYRNERRHKILTDQTPWIMFITGGAILFLSGNYIPGTVEGNTGYGIMSAALLILVFGQGPSALLDVTKILSNIISYVRILALNMASAWMSRTFLLLAELVTEIPLVGPIIGMMIILGSHLFLVTLSSITTFIHSLRLHYVEFFSRFFEGSGVKYSPISVEREYTKLITQWRV